MMRAVHVRLDEGLLISVDEAAKKSHVTRSAYVRKALGEALNRRRVSELEREHALGYQRQPVRDGEFDVWEKEQTWPDS
jgi:metal-responsive CopG/Arc/MetJ family transcriptional regulator